MKRFLLIVSFLVLTNFSPLLGAAKLGNVDYSRGFAGLIKDLTPAVVNISTEQKVNTDIDRQRAPKFPKGSFFEEFREFFENIEPFIERAPESREILSLGSGFIIDESGIIVTNYHVISNAKEITVTLSDNTQVKARVLGRDVKTDLAVLKIKVDKKLPYVKFGNSDNAQVGDWVIAIGNPFGLGGSVSAGIISARSRDINIGTANDFIQTDAAINRGNSGGPLFNIDGEVVGINTAIFSPSGGNVGIGFAIPSNSAESIIKILASGKKVEHGWLGVKIQLMTKEIANSLGLKEVYGALVAEVTKDSPAAKADIKAGDVILEFNGIKVKKMPQLLQLVTRAEVNKEVNIKIYRSGKIISRVVNVGKLPDENKNDNLIDDEDDEQSSFQSDIIGLKVEDLTNEFRKNNNIQNDELQGVVVVKIDRNSDASKQGIKRNDIILQINQVPVRNVQEFNKALEQAKKDKKSSILLLVDKGAGAIFVSIKLK